MSAEEDNTVFTLPTAPAGPWDHLTKNEQIWIELIRVISFDSDPRLTLTRVRELCEVLNTG